MNQKVNIDEKERINQDSNEPKELGNHSIYTYLIAHPSILIAGVSAIVAILSFLINYISYREESQVLQFWNIDSALVSISNPKLIYSLCFSVIYFIMIIIATSLISNTYMAYKPFMEFRLYIKNYLKNCKKLSESNDVLQMIELEEKELRKSYSHIFFSNLLVALILTFISSLLLIFSQDIKLLSTNPILSIIIVMSVQFFVYCFISYLAMRLSISKKKIIAQGNNKMIMFRENIKKAEYPIDKVRKYGIKSCFTNSAVYLMFIDLIMIIFLSLMFLTICQSSTIEEQKQFKTLLIDDTQYVVVYSNTEKMILEEATITDGIVSIYTSKQRIVSVDTYPYEVVTFEKTIRIENNAR